MGFFFRVGIILAFIYALTCASNVLQTCRAVPGDADWPKLSVWKALNDSIGGRLIVTIPQASICHDEPFQNHNMGSCQKLARGWGKAQTFEPHPAEIINPFFQNQSCDPFTPQSQTCKLGYLAAYSINVTNTQDVITGIKFARTRGVRLVVKNTGHDYIGRSTGTGALSLWTWNLKSTSISREYQQPWSSGPAIRLGAGIVAGDAYKIVHESGYQIVGGECASTGITGGYSQGGGHSLPTTQFGMGADQVLEWEVMTPSAEYLVATPNNNSDLYWALSGGGGGTWGVVLTYWAAVDRFLHLAPLLVAKNNTVFFEIGTNTVEIISMTLPGQTLRDLNTLLAPFMGSLHSLGIKPSTNFSEWSSYFDHFSTLYGPLPYGDEAVTIVSNRLIPRDIIDHTETRKELVDVLRTTVTTSDFFFGCYMTNMSNKSLYPSNAVLQAWREASVICNFNAFWNYSVPLQQNWDLKHELAAKHVPAMEAVTPGGGSYVNEMDSWYQGNWQKELYGNNYGRLLSIKQRYDPHNILWGIFSVGGEKLAVDRVGRLCEQ